MAFHSIKRLMPASCRCMESEMIQKVASGFRRPPRALPPKYLRFAKTLASRLFPTGWDTRLYPASVATCTPSLSGAVGAKRSDGGVLGSDIDHASFLAACYGELEFNVPMEAELTVVQSAGKPRPLSKPPSEAILLRPLHNSIYNHLSNQRWLSRGDVCTDSLNRAGFSRHEGSVLTSGDYKSATDGLSIEVAETLLSTILSNSVSVPSSVKKAAMDSLRVTLFSEKIQDSFSVSTGQMMGMYLSFPLLCIQNYLAFRWSCLNYGGGEFFKGVPVIINGDDILFDSEKPFSDFWMTTVSNLGLEVEKTKTSVSSAFGSLNSTLLRWSGKQLLVSPTVRMGMLRTSDDPSSLGTSFSSFVKGLKGDLRYRAGHCFFSWHIGSLRGSTYSTWELGFRGTLALRLTIKFGLPISFQSKAPCLPAIHNVLLPSGSVTWCEPGELSAEERKLSLREMACWKFSFDWRGSFRPVIRHLCEISTRLRASPDFTVLDFPGVGNFPGRRLSWRVSELLRRFCEPLPVNLKSFPAFTSVLALREDVLPPYEEGLRWVEVAKSEEKKC